jgi:hypothetical protein
MMDKVELSERGAMLHLINVLLDHRPRPVVAASHASDVAQQRGQQCGLETA